MNESAHERIEEKKREDLEVGSSSPLLCSALLSFTEHAAPAHDRTHASESDADSKRRRKKKKRKKGRRELTCCTSCGLAMAMAMAMGGCAVEGRSSMHGDLGGEERS